MIPCPCSSEVLFHVLALLRSFIHQLAAARVTLKLQLLPMVAPNWSKPTLLAEVDPAVATRRVVNVEKSAVLETDATKNAADELEAAENAAPRVLRQNIARKGAQAKAAAARIPPAIEWV